ncbi:unnamed protein product [Brassicogethes aeneus]|uniref:Mothers against decapentaplegic homolog n=1 Tax=Brassicogethes aeneus TaxID=1431903 RepID=A0A9P0B2F8_BRAAE|nr:unnamed protein product [Brassicogethes aeneus]
MFMFRKKKTNLTNKLLKARKRRGYNETRGSLEENICHELLKTLEENQLDMLLKAIESRGQNMSNCVLIPRTTADRPHVVCCQEWRWPDLSQYAELRSLPTCNSASDPVYICCNPYHWSRLCQPETPPPPYSRSNSDRLKPEDRAPSEVSLVCRDSYPESFSTNGDSYMTSSAWCKLAYWEQKQRVGDQYHVECAAVNIYGKEPSYGHGISLGNLAQHSFSPPDSVAKTRCKIGLGITLSREDGCVWLYNRSDVPIFVNSLTLEDPDTNPSLNPTRVPAEHCLCVYNPLYAYRYRNFAQANIGPVDPHSIRISFAKGWGATYSRRDITSCPCWLEVLLLAPCR